MKRQLLSDVAVHFKVGHRDVRGLMEEEPRGGNSLHIQT